MAQRCACPARVVGGTQAPARPKMYTQSAATPLGSRLPVGSRLPPPSRPPLRTGWRPYAPR